MLSPLMAASRWVAKRFFIRGSFAGLQQGTAEPLAPEEAAGSSRVPWSALLA